MRAGAALAMLLSAAAIYGLAATSAFGFDRLEVKGAAITNDAKVRERLDLAEGTNLFEIATEPLEARLREIPAVAGAEVRSACPISCRSTSASAGRSSSGGSQSGAGTSTRPGCCSQRRPQRRPSELAGCR